MDASAGTAPVTPQVEGVTRPFADQWFYVFMAALFIATAIAGFSWTSSQLIAAVAAGQRPLPPFTTHFHAALTVAWLLLLLAQTGLVATGRTTHHRKLGMAGIAIGSLLAIALVLLVRREYFDASAAGFQEAVSRTLLFKLKSIVLFTAFFAWALVVRRKDPETHKRMMILATWALLDATLARVAARGWLPQLQEGGFAPYDHAHLYQLLWLSPALLFDLLRRGAPHRAYVIGLALFLPWVVATHLLWNSPWWLSLAPKLMGAS